MRKFPTFMMWPSQKAESELFQFKSNLYCGSNFQLTQRKAHSFIIIIYWRTCNSLPFMDSKLILDTKNEEFLVIESVKNP